MFAQLARRSVSFEDGEPEFRSGSNWRIGHRNQFTSTRKLRGFSCLAVEVYSWRD
jgi:hypothetical protein